VRDDEARPGAQPGPGQQRRCAGECTDVDLVAARAEWDGDRREHEGGTGGRCDETTPSAPWAGARGTASRTWISHALGRRGEAGDCRAGSAGATLSAAFHETGPPAGAQRACT